MSIPDYQSLMLPLLKTAADGKEHTKREVLNDLAERFGLTENERKELLPSGNQEIFDNRLGWARTYLKKAGLIQYTQRGHFQITDRGKTVLAQNPSVINVAYLRQFPEFLEFHPSKRTPSDAEPSESPEAATETPEEVVASGYLKLRRQVEQELLARVKACPRNSSNDSW
jgi:restriction system protein